MNVDRNARCRWTALFLFVTLVIHVNTTPIKAAFHTSRRRSCVRDPSHNGHAMELSIQHQRLHNYHSTFSPLQQLQQLQHHVLPRTVLFAARKKSQRQRQKAATEIPETDTMIADNSKERTEEEHNPGEEKEQKAAPLKTYSGRFLEDNGIRLGKDEEGRVTAHHAPISRDPSQLRNNNNRSSEIESKATNKAQTSIDQEEAASPASPISEAAIATSEGSESTSKKTKSGDKRILPPIFKRTKSKESLREQSATIVPQSGFNVVLTHCTADFDSLASAVGLAKLWASTTMEEEDNTNPIDASSSSGGNGTGNEEEEKTVTKDFDSASHVPTFVVLPRGAHPGVQRFLALHKHLFPIRSLRSLPDDLTGLNRLGLVDAQRRDRIGPAENLLQYANRVTVVDHHIDSETDIPEATDYVVDEVGSVSTLICERLQQAGLELTEAEATLLALGIHADTGSLCFDSTTPRDALSLAWVMGQGASQAAIAEHAQSSLSPEQQGVLTQALINTNSTVVHGVTLSSVLLSADGFINGLAAVTQDALELSSSDLFLLAVVYEAQSGGRRRSKNKRANQGERLTSRLLSKIEENLPAMRQGLLQEGHGNYNDGTQLVAENIIPNSFVNDAQNYSNDEMAQAQIMFAEAWKGGEDAMRRRRLQEAFDRKDLDASGYLELNEIAATLAASGIIASEQSIRELMDAIDTDGDGRIDFEEFVDFAIDAEKRHQEEVTSNSATAKPSTMIIIGRVKAGVNVKGVKLNRLLEKFGGGGHAKAASATVRLNDESEAEGILNGLIEEIIETGLQEQVTVGDFMTAPVLSVKPDMTEKQVEDLFQRYDVRALPVVDDANDVIGLVTYKEVAAAKQRLWNKEQKRLRREKEAAEKGFEIPYDEKKTKERQQKSGSTVKGWMIQHVQLVEDSTTMAELEAILMESDVGCIPVVQEGTKKLIGMVTRTDLLRQHRYYPTLHYHNKGFADSISARKPIIELRKRLKKFDLEND